MQFMIGLCATTALLGVCGSVAAQTSYKWNNINCAESEIVLTNYSECRRTDFYVGEAMGNSGGQFYSQWAGYTGSDSLTYVYLQKGRHPSSSMIVNSDTREAVLTKPTAKVTKEGRNWSATNRVSGGYIKKFTMDDWYCYSFAKDAPYAQSGSGVQYWMFGYSCGKTPASQDDIKAGEFVTKLALRKSGS